MFRWQRRRLKSSRFSYAQQDETIEQTLVVDFAVLFNISAYKPSDYRQFFADHRTRAQYLKWAPLLLAAEDYHASTRDR